MESQTNYLLFLYFYLIESSIVLSLIQEVVNKIRSSELSGQMHFLASSYKKILSTANNAENIRSKDRTLGNAASDNQIRSKSKRKKQTTNCEERQPMDETPEGSVTRTSSGRIVRQRFQLVYNYSEEDDEDTETENNDKDAEQSGNKPPASRPTSLNPFQIPVNLLNFKPVQNKKI